MSSLAPAANPFDTIAGLPVHPLVVHAAVVLLPLGILGLLAVLAMPRLRRHYAWPSLALLLLGAISVVVAKESGEQLAHHLGPVGEHEEWADRLTISALLTLLAAIAWTLLDRLHDRRLGRTLRRQEEAVAEHDAEVYAARDRARERGESDDLPLHVGAVPHVEPARRSGLLTALAPLTALLAAVTLVCVVMTGHTGATKTWQEDVASWSQPASR